MWASGTLRGLGLLAPAALLRALGGGARDVGWGMLADRHTHKEAVVTPEFLCHFRLLTVATRGAIDFNPSPEEPASYNSL